MTDPYEHHSDTSGEKPHLKRPDLDSDEHKEFIAKQVGYCMEYTESMSEKAMAKKRTYTNV